MNDLPVRPSRKRLVLSYAARAVVGGGAVAWLLYQYDLREIGDVALRASVPMLGAGFALGCLGLGLRAMWQQVAFSPVRPMSVGYLLELQFQQSFYSLFMPGESAMLIRWYRIMEPVSKPGVTLAIMWFNQLVIGAMAIGISAAAVAFDDRYPWGGLRVLYPVAVAIGAAGIAALLVANQRSGVVGRLFASRLAWVRDRATDYGRAARETCSLGIVGFLGLMGLSYLAGIAETYFVASAVGIDLPPATLLWLLPAITFVSEFPVSVSGAGVRDLSMVVLFGLYGVDAQAAVACGVLCFGLLLARGAVGGVLEVLRRPARSPGDAHPTAQRARLEV